MLVFSPTETSSPNLGAAPEYGRDLLSGNCVLWTEFAVAIALNNAFGRSPCDSICIPCAGIHIIKGAVPGYRRSACLVIEDLGQHSTGQSVVGTKQSVAITIHQSVFNAVVHTVVIPRRSVGVGEFRDRTSIVPEASLVACAVLLETGLNGVVRCDLLKGIFAYSTHTFAVHHHIGHRIPFIGDNGKGFRSITVDTYLAAGGNGAALSRSGSKGVIDGGVAELAGWGHGSGSLGGVPDGVGGEFACGRR